MNRYLALGCLGLGLMVSPILGGMARSAVPQAKFAVVDLDSTLQNTPAGKRANDAFEKTRKTKQSELDAHQAELKKDDADLDKQKAVLKPDVYAQRRQDLEKKFVALQQTYVKLERELAGERTKLIQDLMKTATPKLAVIAKAEGVAMVLDKEAVIWNDDAIDLTAKLNAEMK